MKVLKKVKSIEVKRAFIVSDFISAKKDRRKHLNFVPENIFKQKLKRAHKKAMRLKESQLDKIIENEYKKRLVAYNNNNWYLGEVKTNEIGVWKRAGDLPLSWTNGSLVETARKVKYAIEHNPKLLKKRSRYSIPNMLKMNIHLLQKEKYLLPIIFKGGTGTKGRKRLKRQMKGDIDDGCMRSIALAISGKKILYVYIGFPKK
ncbi:MAG: hypothetical protein UT09_C0016G0005 [Parcubacteria group bacterium GW2011_GWF2_38_8]|nr:MAG: hypothetical protein UT09_C0016G0005 [Parcubacteria group bacterium GW2011_GWF2_38_8]